MTILTELLIASAMVAVTIVIHLIGLAALLMVMRWHREAAVRSNQLIYGGAGLLVAAFGLFLLHSIEIWLYAVLYYGIHTLPDLETALYFSTSTYATIGYGDLVLPKGWRVVGAIEGANGVILLGWSTAFFVGMVARLRLLERALEE
ncbi:MAG: ion channel [Sphingomonas sp.]